MKKSFLIPIIQLVSTFIYSFSDLECNNTIKEEQMEQIEVITSCEFCESDVAFPEAILVPESASYSNNFFLEASALYWHPKVYGTEFVSQSLFVNDIFKEKEDEDDEDKLIAKKNSIRGSIKAVNLRWDWGFKAGLGYTLPCYDWDIFLSYTGFNSKGCASACVTESNRYLINYKSFLFTSLSEGLKEANLYIKSFLSKGAKSRVHMNLDALKFDLGKSFFICDCVYLHPRIGLEVSWIILKQNTRYTSVQPSLIQNLVVEDDKQLKLLNSLLFDYTIKDCSKFSGIGPCFSLQTQWHFYENFYLYGNVSGTLFSGLFKISHKESMNVFFPEGQDGDEPKVNYPFRLKNCLKESLHNFIPSVDTQIGLAYDTYFNCEKMHFLFKLGFDARYFWRINQILETEDSTLQHERISEDLSIDGVTFDIRVDF